MYHNLFKDIAEVTNLSATSGFEAPVRRYLRDKLTPYVDRIETDGLGGIFGIKEKANAPRVLVAAHMDEVGFMISTIKPDGTFRVVELGGWNPLVVSSQRFDLFLQDGRKIPVISGSLPPIYHVASQKRQPFLLSAILSLMQDLHHKKKPKVLESDQVMSSSRIVKLS